MRASGVKLEIKNTHAKPNSDWRLLLPRLQEIAEDGEDVHTSAQLFHARRRPTITKILQAFKNTRNPQALMRILLNLSERGFVENFYVLRSIESVANHYKDRLRDIETWSVKKQNPARIASLLLRHLFEKFDVPLFLDSVFWKGGTLYQRWFLHIGRGGSLRTAPGLPIEVTKRIAHFFGLAPSHYSVPEALRWGQIHSLGGDRRLAEAVRGTRLVRIFRDDAFWVNVLRFLHSNFSELNQRDINRLIEYIYEIRCVPRKILIAGGGERQVAPPQPGFQLKGKSLKTLLADAVAWEQFPEDRVVGFEWQSSKRISPFQYQTAAGGLFSIRELLSSSELLSEGNTMDHCVGDFQYAHACFSGESSIFSLGYEEGTGSGRESLLTIEVDVEENNIKEMRGYGNRLPTDEEIGIVRIWAMLNRITDTDHLLGTHRTHRRRARNRRR